METHATSNEKFRNYWISIIQTNNKTKRTKGNDKKWQ